MESEEIRSRIIRMVCSRPRRSFDWWTSPMLLLRRQRRSAGFSLLEELLRTSRPEDVVEDWLELMEMGEEKQSSSC